MNGILKIGLIGGGALLAYKYGLFDALLGITAAPSGAPANTATPAPTKSLVLAAAQAQFSQNSPMLSFDQWNAIYKSKRGIDGPDPGGYLTANDRAKLLTLDEWWGYMQQAGMSGLLGLRGGMGVFALPYSYTQVNNPFVREPGVR